MIASSRSKWRTAGFSSTPFLRSARASAHLPGRCAMKALDMKPQSRNVRGGLHSDTALAVRKYETSPERSALMRRVRQSGTALELRVRSVLSSLGARYRLNVRSLPGSPDVVNEVRRKAIFVHGCFWHGHTQCSRGRVPRANRSFWAEKLLKNRERDQRKVDALRELRFDVLVVWECELADPDALTRRLHSFWFGANRR
jgi:DNA mismatch endonuclease (patch repair protein)